MSLTGYYFPNLTMDPLLKARVENSFETTSTPSVSGSNIVWNQDVVEVIPLPEGGEEKQFAARLMFFPAFGTIGFTYHEGYDVKWDVADFDIVKILQDGGSAYTDGDGDNFYYLHSRIGVSDQQLYGFEAAIPINKWTYKFEIASIKTTYSLKHNNANEVFSHALNNKDVSVLPSSYNGNYELAKEYANFVYNENGGKFYFPYLQNIIAVGADADLDRWLINFAVFFIHPIFFDSREKRIAEIEELAFPDDNDGDDWPFFPMFNIGRYNESKTSIKGVAAGVISNGVGFSLYYSRDFKEALRLSASFMGIDYFSNDAVENQNSNTDEYSSGDGIDVGFGVRLEYIAN